MTIDPDRSFEEKVDGLLAAGQEYLDLPNGFLTRIEPDTGDGTQTIVDARGSHDLLQPGESCPLPQSYCRRTIGRDDLMTITNAAKTGWEGDPAHDLFGLETYIGGEVTAGGELYGTLCFAATESRSKEFTETERSFVGLLRRWAGYEIEREND
ncbi:MAG: GAF domain-containing protein, partial [Halobacteriales archaeon]